MWHQVSLRNFEYPSVCLHFASWQTLGYRFRLVSVLIACFKWPNNLHEIISPGPPSKPSVHIQTARNALDLVDIPILAADFLADLCSCTNPVWLKHSRNPQC